MVTKGNMYERLAFVYSRELLMNLLLYLQSHLVLNIHHKILATVLGLPAL